MQKKNLFFRVLEDQVSVDTIDCVETIPQRRKWLSLSKSGMVEAATTVKEMAPTIISIVNLILTHLS